jgi:hypothetical protein
MGLSDAEIEGNMQSLAAQVYRLAIDHRLLQWTRGLNPLGARKRHFEATKTKVSCGQPNIKAAQLLPALRLVGSKEIPVNQMTGIPSKSFCSKRIASLCFLYFIFRI